MRKFECNDCSRNCKIEYNPKGTEDHLYFCVKADVATHWHEVEEENTQQFGKTEQLPDWVKVGAIGYDNELKDYFEVTNVSEKWIDIQELDGGNGATCSYADIQKCSETRKRPFNDAEMKALVGRLLTTVDGDVSIATVFDNTLKELWIACKCFKNKELANSKWLLDGKPCYKLEHLENGEWVE